MQQNIDRKGESKFLNEGGGPTKDE